jgi:hypothetical protein
MEGIIAMRKYRMKFNVNMMADFNSNKNEVYRAQQKAKQNSNVLSQTCGRNELDYICNVKQY